MKNIEKTYTVEKIKVPIYKDGAEEPERIVHIHASIPDELLNKESARDEPVAVAHLGLGTGKRGTNKTQERLSQADIHNVVAVEQAPFQKAHIKSQEDLSNFSDQVNMAVYNRLVELGVIEQDEKVIDIGESLGSIAAAEFADKHPELVERLELIHAFGLQAEDAKLVKTLSMIGLSGLQKANRDEPITSLSVGALGVGRIVNDVMTNRARGIKEVLGRDVGEQLVRTVEANPDMPVRVLAGDIDLAFRAETLADDVERLNRELMSRIGKATIKFEVMKDGAHTSMATVAGSQELQQALRSPETED